MPVEAREHFPTLAQNRATLLSTGKEKISIDLRQMGAEAQWPVVERAGICVLTRTEGGPTLRRLASEVLNTKLVADREYGFDQYSDSIGESVSQLTSDGGWALDLGHHSDAVIPFIREMFDEIDRRFTQR